MWNKPAHLIKKAGTAISLSNLITLIYAFLVGVFSAYFVLLNNTHLILYSFMAFLALSFILAIKDKYAHYSALIAISLIIIGNLLYSRWFGSIMDYYLIIFGVVVGASVTALIHGIIERRYAFFALFAVSMLLLLELLGFEKFTALDINVVILGYYLLISVVFAMAIKIIYENGWQKLRTAAKSIKHAVKASDKRVIGISAVIGILLLILPIWPIGVYTPVSGQPYVQISLSNLHKNNITTNNHANNTTPTNLYSMTINISKYKNFLNPIFSNIRFYYVNGTPIRAYTVQFPNYYGNLQELVLRLSNNTENYTAIRMYLMPYNTSYGRGLMLVHYAPNGTISPNISARLGAIANTWKVCQHFGTVLRPWSERLHEADKLHTASILYRICPWRRIYKRHTSCK